MFRIRSIVPLALILICLSFTAVEARADSIVINSSTVLLNSTNFTGGPYVAVFQLVGGGTDNNIAQLSNFNFGGGVVFPFDPLGGSSGLFAFGPDPSDLDGIGQSFGTLQLQIASGNASALFMQMINPGTLFSFDFSLTNNFTPGNSFDAFTFQLYDSDLTTLLYEQQFDITGAPQSTPEPAALFLLGSGLSVLAGALRRRRTAAFEVRRPDVALVRRGPNRLPSQPRTRDTKAVPGHRTPRSYFTSNFTM
jgi:hypothetical protein